MWRNTLCSFGCLGTNYGENIFKKIVCFNFALLNINFHHYNGDSFL